MHDTVDMAATQEFCRDPADHASRASVRTVALLGDVADLGCLEASQEWIALACRGKTIGGQIVFIPGAWGEWTKIGKLRISHVQPSARSRRPHPSKSVETHSG